MPNDKLDIVEKVAADMHEAWRVQAEKEFAPKKAPILAEEDVPYSQLRDYDKRHYRAEARAAIAVVVEEAAKVAMSVPTHYEADGRLHLRDWQEYRTDIPAAIRAINPKER